MKRPVIYLSIKGGLGNQMFEYAFSRYLYSKSTMRVKFVWFHFLYAKHHNGIELTKIFKLEDLKIPKYVSLYIYVGRLLNKYKLNYCIAKCIKLLYISFSETHYQNTPYSFDIIPILKNRHYYYDGFWQNYKYIEPIKEEILNLFQFKISDNNQSLNNYRSQIIDSYSVSVHIRRGDYLNKEFSDLNVIKSLNFYHRAIKLIKSQKPNAKFFFFSDDIKWVKDNLYDQSYIYIHQNKDDWPAYYDMYLMTQCNSNIISNSTFSWWGAWLNKNEHKIVIAPSIWSKNITTSTFCPKEWIFLNIE